MPPHGIEVIPAADWRWSRGINNPEFDKNSFASIFIWVNNWLSFQVVNPLKTARIRSRL
jgi:hypothetical protein